MLLGAALLLALALRLYKIADIALRADEAANVLLAAASPAEIIRPFITEDPHLPLYDLLLHFWMLLAGQSELAARFPAVFAGVLVVALTFRLGNIVFPQRPEIALVGACLAAINPYLIWDAQEVYMYSWLTALTLAAAVAFFTVVSSRTGARRHTWVGYILAGALGLYMHYLAALALLAQGVLTLVLWRTRRLAFSGLTALLAAQGAMLALFLPWLIFVIPLLAGFRLDFFPPVTLFEMVQRTVIAFGVGRVDARLMPPMVDPLAGSVFGLAFLALFLLGLLARGSADRAGRAALALYIAVPLAALYVFSAWRFPIYDERYVLFLIPPFLVVIARGLAFLLQRMPRAGAVPAFALVALASSNSLFNYFYVPAYAKSPDWHGFIAAIVSEARPGDVLIQNYPDPALPYYLDNRLPRVLLPRTGTAAEADVDADLQRLTGKYGRIWLQPVAGGEWDYAGLVETWLDRHARQESVSNWRGVRLTLYTPAAKALQQAKPVGAVFDDRVRLIAFDWNARTGQLVLYWQPLVTGGQDATVFVHLYGSDGKLWSQQDNAPVRGNYPVSEWKSDEVVVDTYDLKIPREAPDGSYSLMVGLYNSQTLQRLPVVGGDVSENRVLLAVFNRSAAETLP